MSRFMAAIYDRFMEKSERACLRAWRKELLVHATGSVLELGAGTGANLPYYTDAATEVVLGEPDPHMRKRLARALDRGDRRFAISDANVERLPFADASFDTVVSTLLFCSVPDQAKALREAARVLKPGGAFIYLEHIAATDNPARLGWQRRTEPFWNILADGCCLTRRTDLAIRAAGFDVEIETFESMRKALPILRPCVRGIARSGLARARVPEDLSV